MGGQRLDPAQLGGAGEQGRDQHDAHPSQVDSSSSVAPAGACADLDHARTRLLSISLAFGVFSGAVSGTTGRRDHSLAVLAVGLGVLADVTGSAVLIWRFRAERGQPVQSDTPERRAAIFVAVALAVVSA